RRPPTPGRRLAIPRPRAPDYRPVSFSTLALIAVAGLAGPLVSSSRRIVVPVIVGELLAGMALGKTGAGLIDASNPTVDFLGEVGFATLMFVARMHVPLRNKALLGALRRGALGP